MGEGEYRSGDVVIRRMRREDADRVEDVAYGVLGHHRPAPRSGRAQGARPAAFRALPRARSGGAVGRRDRRRGGRQRERDRARGALGSHALRRRARASGSGGRAEAARRRPRVRRRGARRVDHVVGGPQGHAPLRPGGVRPAPLRGGRRDAADGSCPSCTPRSRTICATTEPISRAVRGASHGDDLAGLLDGGRPLLTLPAASPSTRRAASGVLAALDDDTATRLLRACFAQAPRGATVQLDLLTAGQDWAIRPCLEAGLALSPSGAVFTRGTSGRCGRMSRRGWL